MVRGDTNQARNQKRQEITISCLFLYLAPLGGLFPLPPPEGLPVVLGALTGLDPFAIFKELINETYSIAAFSAIRILFIYWFRQAS